MKIPTHYKQIDDQERETIALGTETGLGLCAIGRMFARLASAISQEIERRRKQGKPAPRLIAGNA